MKAAVYSENGPPEVLRYEDVADPVDRHQGVGECALVFGSDGIVQDAAPFVDGAIGAVGYLFCGDVCV